MAAVSDGRFISYCANWITCMSSIVFDVHTMVVGCNDQVCTMFVVMSAVAGRTHVNWRYRTLRLGVIRQG